MAEHNKGGIPDEAKLGFAILLAIIVFVYGLFFLKDIRVSSDTYLIRARFANVAGLKRSDPVQLGGVRIGKVDRVGLDGQQPIVYLRLEDEYQIPKDSFVQVVDRSVMGEKSLEVHRGQSPEMAQEGDILNGETGTGLNTILPIVDSMSVDFRTLITKMNALLDPKSDTSVKQSLANVQELTDVLNKTLTQERQRIHQLVTNMATVSNTLQEVSASERGKISTTMSNLEKSSTELRDVTTRLQRSTGSLETILHQVERGEGTLGKLVNDDKLYTDLNKLVTNLDGLVTDVKKNPKRYIGFSIF
ncbi:MAG: MCE family protein [Candidatus Latescibacteria bacterium]|nr:MCE family protein [Candidatus Latescibacterota bacterium]